MHNPFTPTFGTSPSHPVGRQEVLVAFQSALDQGPGAPSRALLLIGTRGVGKTVLLNELEDTARSNGMHVISETALPGLLSRFTDDHLPALLRDIDPRATGTRLTGFSAPAGLGGVRTERVEKHEPDPGLRSLLNDVLSHATNGLFLTVDEVGRATVDELAELMAAIQHLFRENKNITFAIAGLPEEVNALLDHPGITFLRRADRHLLGAVTPEDALRGLQDPVREAGGSWDAAALQTAMQATHGYPFLIQLIGYHSWNRATDGKLDLAAAQRGIELAHAELGKLVLEPVLSRCTELELAFLTAMAEDDGDSKLADIIERIDRSADTASQYRRRLIDRFIIVPSGHGLLRFAIPGLRDFLRRKQDAAPIPFW
ncbi:ATP-binding protein [Corynebacterium sp. H127]|uniref:ATP-binding protein n=1 Tax=Corynebacterium sp. H127 TaxID=3133418 RepID=UPI0030B32711